MSTCTKYTYSICFIKIWVQNIETWYIENLVANMKRWNIGTRLRNNEHQCIQFTFAICLIPIVICHRSPMSTVVHKQRISSLQMQEAMVKIQVESSEQYARSSAVQKQRTYSLQKQAHGDVAREYRAERIKQYVCYSAVQNQTIKRSRMIQRHSLREDNNNPVKRTGTRHRSIPEHPLSATWSLSGCCH